MALLSDFSSALYTQTIPATDDNRLSEEAFGSSSSASPGPPGAPGCYAPELLKDTGYGPKVLQSADTL